MSWLKPTAIIVGSIAALVLTGAAGPHNYLSAASAFRSAESGPILQAIPDPDCQPVWNLVPGAFNNASYSLLKGISAVSADDVWAVGYYRDNTNAFRTLAHHWDGSEWTEAAAPNASTADNKLYAVAAVSHDTAWAVGTYSTTVAGPQKILIERFDGAHWNIETSPNVGVGNSHLYGVSAPAANDAWAVGDYTDTNGRLQALALHWDGSAWTQVPVPPIATYNSLEAVSAVSAADVWAVGYKLSVGPVVYILHWDGTQWQAYPDQFVGIMYGIVAVAANDVWASGIYATDVQLPATQVLHWNGVSWANVPSPNGSDNLNYLYGIDAVSAGDIWAVGYYRSDGGRDEPLVERWNGANWTIVPTQYLKPDFTTLYGVSAVASFDAWAVGSFAYAPESPYTAVMHGGRFSDVIPTDYFAAAVSYLVGLGAVSGYDDCTFRPSNNTTRGQLCKIITLANGWTIYAPSIPTFRDVPSTDPFYQYIETVYHQGVVSGYNCGTDCLEFRPAANITRGQVCKIVVNAEGWPLYTPPTPTFQDVPPTHEQFAYIETAYNRGIISGYGDGTFRPGNPATRGQISKIVYNAITAP